MLMRDREERQLRPSGTRHYMGAHDLFHKELSKQGGTVMPNEFYTEKSHGISEEGKGNKNDIYRGLPRQQ